MDQAPGSNAMQQMITAMGRLAAERYPVARYGPWGKPTMRVRYWPPAVALASWQGKVRGAWRELGLVASLTPRQAAIVYCGLLCDLQAAA